MPKSNKKTKQKVHGKMIPNMEVKITLWGVKQDQRGVVFHGHKVSGLKTES